MASQRTDVAEQVVELYKRVPADPSAHASQADCFKLLSYCAQKFDWIYLVVDALDECSEDEAVWRDLINDVRKYTPGVNILVTTRPLANIENTFQNAVKVTIHA